MQIDQLTPRQLRTFHKRLGKALGVRYFSHGPIFWILKALYDRYLKPYLPLPEELIQLRPMCLGKSLVVLNYQPGCKDKSPLEQVEIFVHECTHSLRLRKYPKAPAHWMGAYFTKDTFRALEEASSQEAQNQVRYWCTGNFPALRLNSYRISKEAFVIADVAYNKTKNHTVKRGRGHTTHRAAQQAIQILRTMGVKRQK